MWKILAMEAELLQIQTLKTPIGGICSLGNFCTSLSFYDWGRDERKKY